MAMRVLAVPATSAPVERVVSQGGLIMRTHRASLSAKTAKSNLLFLKCNLCCLKIFQEGERGFERASVSFLSLKFKLV